jgi:NAD+ kinase
MRNVLVVTHTGRADALAAAQEVCSALISAGLTPVMTKIELEDHRRFSGDQVAPNHSLDGIKVLDEDVAAEDVELAMVLGGDGTILKAAEIVRDAQTPLLGINLGHVGFLAESERDGLTDAVRRVVERDYVVKQRLALDVTVFVEGKEAFKTWALNEAAIEKNSREKMLEVVLEIDRRPLSSFGCDGVVVATPTGSTAYSFSAGGPVVWPSVEALLVVPLSAHALFARPLVVSPKSMIAVEIMERSAGSGVLWCDGRRTWELPPGARVEIKRSTFPVRLARFRQGVFTDRLVRKFSLPVVGWRGHEGGEQS